MKYLLFVCAMFLGPLLSAQNVIFDESSEKVIVDNDKMKVVEYVSLPQGSVCGEGMHHHEPHLTVVVSDAKVRITPETGESQEAEVKAGTSIWFGTDETHSVTNIGDKPTKMLLVYLKE